MSDRASGIEGYWDFLQSFLARCPSQFLFGGQAPTRLTLGKLQIDLRRNTGRLLGLAERSSGLVAQALRDVGKDRVTAEHLRRVRNHLTAPARQQLLQDIPLIPA